MIVQENGAEVAPFFIYPSNLKMQGSACSRKVLNIWIYKNEHDT
ncbi:hypothetical protein VQ7734_02759 [Vibrio quintilis]|uniref:Uncharacterized protein n=1 Tax=Vibrio quintilis TaxID=1117707 RepID=A0A1M7YWA4_9VIBR|nr:hypothetical protein VQ7734_02759 [Vibrio quintilis]